ncbi:phage head spike fiber domain-containing protein [Cupriavidus necator]
MPAVSLANYFTRASAGWYFNSAGLLVQAAANAPRFDYDPVTLALRGLLIEEARTNLLTYSDQFDNAAWSKSNATVTANAAVAPDGTMSADKLVENTAATTGHSVNSAIVTVGATQAYTVTCFAKKAERDAVSLWLRNSDGSTNYVFASFDLTTGTQIGSISPAGTGYSNFSTAVQDVGNGWYRCSLTATVDVSVASIRGWVRLVSSGLVSYTGDGTSGLYIWGAQLEVGAFPTSYIPTTSAQVTRSADLLSILAGDAWLSQSAGTFYAEFQGGQESTQSTYGRAVGYANSSASSLSMIGMNGATGSLGSWNGTTNLTKAVAVADFFMTGGKAALAWDATGRSLTANGATPASDSSTPGLMARLSFGGNLNGTNNLNGHIKEVRYYPRRLSNAELPSLTA